MPVSQSPRNPDAFHEWVRQLEQEWQAGRIPNPQAVAVILVNERAEVLLQLRDNHPSISYPGSWTLPGGVVESCETPAQAAQREFAEETGLRVELSLWKTYERKPERHQFMIEQYIYTGKIRAEIDEMTLGEGQSLRFFRRDELATLRIAFGFDRLLEEFFEGNSQST